MPLRPDAPDLCRFLNDLLALDPHWLQALLSHRPPCNRALAEHLTVQVRPGVRSTPPSAGVLGLLNGYLGTLENGPRQGRAALRAVFDDQGYLVSFSLDDGLVTDSADTLPLFESPSLPSPP